MTQPARVALVTDSTACMPPELYQKYSISVAPQVLIWGNETFRDGVDIQPNEFYKRLAKATVMPSTSQVTPSEFYAIFKQLTEQGQQVLAILVAATLSGTIASAVQAKAMLPPNQAEQIEIVDSHSVAMAMGFHLLEAGKAAAQGASLAECKALAEEARNHTGVVLTVDTLEFLHRGGRIGGATRFLGTALNIKPILELRDGRIEALERVRTRGKSLNRLVELAEKGVAGRKPVRLAFLHANAEADALKLMNLTNGYLKPVEFYITPVSPVIGTHTGPGTAGIVYMAGM
jgi:DegV family protein with EDD domain